MCDPVTIGIALVSTAAIAGVAATGVSMYSSQQQGKFQKDMMGYQSDLARQRAKLAEQNAEIQAGRLAEQRRQQTAAGMAGFAANGLLIDDASAAAPNIWEQDMAAETAWQQEEIRTQAMYEAWGLNANASMLTAQGSMARRGAALEMWGAGLSGLSGAAGAGAAIYGMLPSEPGKVSSDYAGAAGTHGGSAMTAYA